MKTRTPIRSGNPSHSVSKDSETNPTTRFNAQRNRQAELKRKAYSEGRGYAGHSFAHVGVSAPHLNSSSDGRPLPDNVREKMEVAFGQDFSNVQIHQDRNAEALGAHAYTRGNHIHFAPGKYKPATHEGREILGHELTHVVQQRLGQVPVPSGNSTLVNADAALEVQADRMGARVAREPGTGSKQDTNNYTIRADRVVTQRCRSSDESQFEIAASSAPGSRPMGPHSRGPYIIPDLLRQRSQPVAQTLPAPIQLKEVFVPAGTMLIKKSWTFLRKVVGGSYYDDHEDSDSEGGRGQDSTSADDAQASSPHPSIKREDSREFFRRKAEEEAGNATPPLPPRPARPRFAPTRPARPGFSPTPPSLVQRGRSSQGKKLGRVLSRKFNRRMTKTPDAATEDPVAQESASTGGKKIHHRSFKQWNRDRKTQKMRKDRRAKFEENARRDEEQLQRGQEIGSADQDDSTRPILRRLGFKDNEMGEMLDLKDNDRVEYRARCLEKEHKITLEQAREVTKLQKQSGESKNNHQKRKENLLRTFKHK